MNATLLCADCLPRGGHLKVTTSTDPMTPAFKVTATNPHARALDEVQKAVRGETGDGQLDARCIQPYLTQRLSRSLNAGLTLTVAEGVVELAAG